MVSSGKIIQDGRLKKSLSREEFALKIGVTPSFVVMLEAGLRRASLYVYMKVAGVIPEIEKSLFQALTEESAMSSPKERNICGVCGMDAPKDQDPCPECGAVFS